MAERQGRQETEGKRRRFSVMKINGFPLPESGGH
jgi:hypothetical protein